MDNFEYEVFNKDFNFVPKGWDVKRLKYLCDIQTGTTPDNTEGINTNEGFNFYSSEDFNPSFKLEKSEKYIEKEYVKRNTIKLYPKNSILMTTTGSKIGECGYTTQKSYSNQNITAIIPKKINYKYLLYYLISKSKDINDNRLYTTVKKINNTDLSNIKITIPPQEKQQQITNILDKKCKTIDGILLNKEKSLKKMMQFKYSLIYEYSSGKKWI